ncbi:MAG: hypothetical protein JST52_06425 [Bacteroidetes bacterium]|nr:hypothetical protein [Bacteroidota bacterium]MBS1739099.1 hypothetical protein [Bacteroidota bacterium]
MLNHIQLLRYRLFLILLIGLNASIVYCQNFGSNYHVKTITTADSVRLDSLSVVPFSVFIDGVNDSDFLVLPAHSLLVWKHKPKQDSVRVYFRTMPLRFDQVYHHKSRKYDSSSSISLIYRFEDRNTNNFGNFNELEYNGSYGRSISMGNNQDVVLNSLFNLQANGYILDSIKLEAALSDNTIPVQPDGNTQRLQEFDQVYIRLSKKQHLLQLGDYNLESPPGYFLKFYKRVQGIYYQTGFRINKSVQNKLGLSGSMPKGQFARNIFQGLEGNQGPYKLSGNNSEQFFIVLAGTERVYVDDVPMSRGENADYIINYNTAEIKFMPRKMITKDSRIQVEFEYQARNYLNSLIYAWDEVQVGKKLTLRVNAYSNQDAKNQPYLQSLSTEQKYFLSTIGDSIQNALYPNIVRDTFSLKKILYKRIDSLVNGTHYDSVFVYSVSPDSAIYSLTFSFVGQGKGDYVISPINANGRVYVWVAPVNGVHQGSYAPVQLLITPKKQQVFVLNGKYDIDSLKTIHVEVSASNVDPNLFSKIDNNSHWGGATKISYNEKRKLGKVDSNGKQAWVMQNTLSYEFIQDRYQAIAPYRNVEFARDWNIPYSSNNKPDEHLIHAGAQLSNRQLGRGQYDFTYYGKGSFYKGFRHILAYELTRKAISAGFSGNLMTNRDSSLQSVFFRPNAFMTYTLPKRLSAIVGAKYELQHNAIRNMNSDTLTFSAFSFDVISGFIRNADLSKNKWSLTYFTRRDRIPVVHTWKQQSHSDNVDLRFGLYHWRNQQINFTGSYRHLLLDDTSHVSSIKPEETLLGRLEYSGNFFQHALSANSLYEFGSGQEQKRSYTFVEVPAGQGLYMWVDYNHDGVQQANEFEIAIYPDQKKYIKVFTPTNEYVKVNYVNFNGTISLEPSYLWQGKKLSSLQKIISRFSSQTSLQISNKLLAAEGIRAYNPLLPTQNDTTIILTNSSLSSSAYFNRSSAVWGIDYNLISNSGKQLLIYGVEGNRSIQHLYRIRWNIIRPLTAILTAKNGLRSYRSALQDNRTYDVRQLSGEPSLTWILKSVFRLTGSLKWEERNNASQYGGEKATIQSCNLDFRFSKPNLGVIQIRGTFSGIVFSGQMSAPVAFIMLDALQPGNNFLWFMNWERRVGKGIELSLEYEGRKPGTGNVVHTGRMSIRAIL